MNQFDAEATKSCRGSCALPVDKTNRLRPQKPLGIFNISRIHQHPHVTQVRRGWVFIELAPDVSTDLLVLTLKTTSFVLKIRDLYARASLVL